MSSPPTLSGDWINDDRRICSPSPLGVGLRARTDGSMSGLLPPEGVAFRDCATVGSFDEFLVGVDDLGGGFALVPFSSVGSMMVVVGEVVGEVAA